MAGKQPAIVAELGRPETPEETAARKAENSRKRRANQTAFNLIVATIASLGIVLFLVVVVVRPNPEPAPGIETLRELRRPQVGAGHLHAGHHHGQTGEQPDPAPVANSACYSPITAGTASWLTAVYQYDGANRKMVLAANGGNTVGATAIESASVSSGNFRQMTTWFNTLMGDSFG